MKKIRLKCSTEVRIFPKSLFDIQLKYNIAKKILRSSEILSTKMVIEYGPIRFPIVRSNMHLKLFFFYFFKLLTYFLDLLDKKICVSGKTVTRTVFKIIEHDCFPWIDSTFSNGSHDRLNRRNTKLEDRFRTKRSKDTHSSLIRLPFIQCRCANNTLH